MYKTEHGRTLVTLYTTDRRLTLMLLDLLPRSSDTLDARMASAAT
jgi:hypothetical protein